MKSEKIVNICLIITCVFLYLVASQIAELVFDWLEVAATRDYLLTLPEIVSIVFCVLVFVLARRNKRLTEFLNEAVNELSKISYPTKKESGQSAVVVIVMVGIATLFLALFDSVWSFFTQLILTTQA